MTTTAIEYNVKMRPFVEKEDGFYPVPFEKINVGDIFFTSDNNDILQAVTEPVPIYKDGTTISGWKLEVTSHV